MLPHRNSSLATELLRTPITGIMAKNWANAKILPIASWKLPFPLDFPLSRLKQSKLAAKMSKQENYRWDHFVCTRMVYLRSRQNRCGILIFSKRFIKSICFDEASILCVLATGWTTLILNKEGKLLTLYENRLTSLRTLVVILNVYPANNAAYIVGILLTPNSSSRRFHFQLKLPVICLITRCAA